MPPPSLSLSRRRAMWRSRVLAGLLVLGSGSSARAQEPQAIVGDWVGERSNGLGASDAVYMTARVTEVSEVGSVPLRTRSFWRVPVPAHGGEALALLDFASHCTSRSAAHADNPSATPVHQNG